MKKLTKIIVALCMCLFPFVLFAGCGEPKISSMSVKAGTLETTIAKGDTLNLSDTIVIVKYSDGTNKEVGADDLTFGTVDTTTVGNKTLSISYTDSNDRSSTIKVTIRVVATEADVASISTLTSQLLTEYQANRSQSDNNNIKFYDQDQPLYVGDDNPFHFRLLAGGYDGSGAFVANITEVRTNMSVSLLGDDPMTIDVEPEDTVTPLQGTSLEYFVTVDTEKSTLDFTQDAVGCRFRVTVEAANKDITAQENAVKFTADLEIIDAYNVYDAKDLIVYDNSNDGYYDEQRAALGLTYEDIQAINGIVLQSDIVIEREDVREDIFWSEDDPNYAVASKNFKSEGVELKDTPKDRSGTGLYYREIAEGDTFNFIGNYFTIDLSKFPLMVVESDGKDDKKAVWSEKNEKGEYVDAQYMTSHLCVFYTKTSNKVAQKTQVNWSNMGFVGNSTLNNDPIYSGGILLMKNNEVNFTAYNTIINNFYIGYFVEQGEKNNSNTGKFVVDSCKGYNYYQCIFYVWGAKDFLIKDSEFVQAGGPAIITDHCEMEKDNPDTGYPSHVDVVNTTIESVVTAQSPWFTTYKATDVVLNIVTLEKELFQNTNKTMLVETKEEDGDTYEKLNIIAVAKSDGSDIDLSGGTLFDVRGYVRLFDTEDDYNKYYGYGEYAGKADKTVAYGLELSGDSDSIYQRALSNSIHYMEDGANGGYINANAKENPDLTIFFGNKTKVNGMLTIINTALEQAKLENYKIDATEFEKATLAQQKTMLQQALVNIGTIPTYNTVLLNGIYSNAVSNKVMVDLGDKWTNADVNGKVALLNAEIARYADTFEGDYFNLYTSMGVGAIIGLYDRKAA